MFPLCFNAELSENTSLIEEKKLLEAKLIYGSYPEVINHAGKEKEALQEIASSYLFKDILKLKGIRKSSILEKLNFVCIGFAIPKFDKQKNWKRTN